MSKLLGHTTHDHSAEFVIARAVHVAPAGACMGCHKVIQTAVCNQNCPLSTAFAVGIDSEAVERRHACRMGSLAAMRLCPELILENNNKRVCAHP